MLSNETNTPVIYPTPGSIVILRALQLGDLLCAVPAFRALRAALPEARITLVGLPWSSAFVERFHAYLDDFIELTGFPGLPEQPDHVLQFPAFLSEVQSRKFDLALQMHGSGVIVNPLAVLFGASQTTGFYMKDQYCPDPDRYLLYPDGEPEIWRMLRLVEFMGIPLQGAHLEFPLTREDEEGYALLAASYGLEPGKYICLHPGARDPLRRWPVEYFAACAQQLAERGFRIVLTGTGSESALTAAVAAQTGAPVLDLAGQTSLGVLGALLSKARLLVSNDTGVSHLADSLKVPSVVLFKTTDPGRWAPLDHRLHRVISWADPPSAAGILKEVDQLLEQEPLRAS